MLSKKHIALLRRIIEYDGFTFMLPARGKILDDLESAGMVFVKDSDLSMFGDKSVIVRPSIDGESYLEELDEST